MEKRHPAGLRSVVVSKQCHCCRLAKPCEARCRRCRCRRRRRCRRSRRAGGDSVASAAHARPFRLRGFAHAHRCSSAHRSHARASERPPSATGRSRYGRAKGWRRGKRAPAWRRGFEAAIDEHEAASWNMPGAARGVVPRTHRLGRHPSRVAPRSPRAARVARRRPAWQAVEHSARVGTSGKPAGGGTSSRQMRA